MPAVRLMPTPEAAHLNESARAIAKELRPRVDDAERSGAFPRDVFLTLRQAGLLGVPYAEEYGGAALPFEVYLQVLGEIAAARASVCVGTSVHILSRFGLFHTGTEEQRRAWLPGMLGGGLLGACCLSEADAGSDPTAMRTRAVRNGDDYVITGAKAWITHAGHVDFYQVMARTSDNGSRGISCSLVPGLTVGKPEDKMGLMGSTPATMRFDGVSVPARRRLGAEGQGLPIALPGWTQAVHRGRRDRGRPGRPRRHGPLCQGGETLASRSSGTRGSRSCSPTWPRRSSPPAPPTATPRASRMRDARSPSRLRLRSWSPPTPSRCSAAPATPTTSRSSATCARPR